MDARLASLVFGASGKEREIMAKHKLQMQRRKKLNRLSEKEYIIVRMLQLYASASEGVKHNPKSVIGHSWISYENSIGRIVPSFTVQNIKLDWHTFYRDEFVSVPNV